MYTACVYIYMHVLYRYFLASFIFWLWHCLIAKHVMETGGRRRIYIALQSDYLTCSSFCGTSVGIAEGNVDAVEELILVWFP